MGTKPKTRGRALRQNQKSWCRAYTTRTARVRSAFFKTRIQPRVGRAVNAGGCETLCPADGVESFAFASAAACRRMGGPTSLQGAAKESRHVHLVVSSARHLHPARAFHGALRRAAH